MSLSRSQVCYSIALGVALLISAGCNPNATQNANNAVQNSAIAGNSNAAQNSNAIANANQQATGSRKDLSAIAAQVLIQTDEARQAIAKKDKQQALQHVQQALDQVGKLGGRASVPIYTEFERVSIIAPITAAKRQAGGQAANSNQPATNANRQAANANRQAASNANRPAPLGVEGVAGGYTRIALDVNIAKDRLQAAKAALDQGNLDQADAALLAVQNGVILESVTANLPLVRARENLVLARTMVEQGRFRDARAPLRQASEALGNYTLVASVKHADEAKALRQEIDSYAQTIEQNHTDAVSKIDGWWNRVTDWLEEPQ